MRNIKDEKRAYRDTHFKKELDSLKVGMARITSLLKQALRNASGEYPSNWLATFVQTQATTRLEERLGKGFVLMFGVFSNFIHPSLGSGLVNAIEVEYLWCLKVLMDIIY